MTTVNIDNPVATSLAEKDPLFRNDTLLPNGPASCIVVPKWGVRHCPEPSRLIQMALATGLAPLPLSHADLSR